MPIKYYLLFFYSNYFKQLINILLISHLGIYKNLLEHLYIPIAQKSKDSDNI